MKRLHDLDTAEVSLVSKGANKKKFLVLKSDIKMNKELQDLLVKTDQKVLKQVDKVLKEYAQKDTDHEGPLDERAQAAVKAVVRILSPFKDQLSPMLLHQVLSTAGIQTAQAEEADTDQGGEGFMDHKTGSSHQSPEPIKEEHHVEAMKTAMKGYKDHLTKLGYKMYPDAQVQQKSVPGQVEDEPGQEEEQEGMPVGDGKHADMHKPEVGAMSHDTADEQYHKRASVFKSLTAKLPKDVKASVEMIFKEQAELIKKNSQLSENLAFERNLRRKKEFVEKAAKYKNLNVPKDELASTLLKAADSLPQEEFEKIEKLLSTADTQVAKSGLFGEIGTSLSRTGGSDAEAKIDAAVQSIIQKSEGKSTYAESYERFISSPEGQRLYAEYKEQRGGI